MFPSDEQELDRLDMHHALMLALFDGKLQFAPIGPNPQRVIDLGTGTGMQNYQRGFLYPQINC